MSACGCSGSTGLRTDDLTVPQGSDFGYVWPVFTADGTPLDITGWTAVMEARQSVGGELRATFSTGLGNGITISGNELTLLIDGDDSVGWTWQRAVYEIRVSSPTEGPFYFTSGTLRVKPGVIEP